MVDVSLWVLLGTCHSIFVIHYIRVSTQIQTNFHLWPHGFLPILRVSIRPKSQDNHLNYYQFCVSSAKFQLFYGQFKPQIAEQSPAFPLIQCGILGNLSLSYQQEKLVVELQLISLTKTFIFCELIQNIIKLYRSIYFLK